MEALKLMLWGMTGIFGVVFIIYFMIKLLIILFPAKKELE